MNYLKTHAPWALGLIGEALKFLMPSINSYTAAHQGTVEAILLALVVAAYYKQSPLGASSAAIPAPPAKNFPVIALLALALLPQPLRAQATTPSQPTNIYAAGITYNQSGTPSIAGTALYAHSLSDGSGTYAFTLVDAIPTSTRPFVVTTSTAVGIAQRIATIGKVPLYIPTAAGVAWNGQNTGWAWSTGVMFVVKLKGNWRLLPNVRVLGSSASNQSGIQPIGGALISWGK